MGVRTTYLALAETRPRLHHALYPWVAFARAFLLDVKAMPRQLLQIDFIRWLLCLPRYLVGFVLLRRYRTHAGGTGVSQNTIAHNIRGSGDLSAPRSHLLIRPLVCLGWVSRNIRDLKVLTIGPRVEGEIYNLVGYGFRRRNIRGLDLFSYSPRVDVGDMHDMPYPDNSFDIVISSAVMVYSDDKQLTANEMKRVCKPGGVIAINNGYSEHTDEEVVKLGGLLMGSNEKVSSLPFVERLFGATPENTYFRYDGSLDRVNGSPIILICRSG